MSRKAALIAFLSVLMTLLGLSGPESHEQKAIPSVREMQSVMEFLGSDLLEGRAPGTRGGELAEAYMASVFKLLDIQPYFSDYYQPFELQGYASTIGRAVLGGTELPAGDEIVGVSTGDQPDFDVAGDVVFAGFGIHAPDWKWDDYKDVPVKGKILVIRVNEPARDDPAVFEGESLTYYGRWIYKFEEAARHGARGVLLIHSTDSAGYGWTVVRNSWGGEQLFLPSALRNDLRFRGWIREATLRDILAKRGIDLADLYRASESRDFQPRALGLSCRITGHNRQRRFTTRNVVGFIPGNDPEFKDRSIVLSAHIDHLGMDPARKGDKIFNGTIDNGSAVAAMVMTAKLLKARQADLRYSVIVLACQAEESGLLGSHYFVDSLSDPRRIIADINFESTPVWGPSKSIMGVGARFSSLEDILKKILPGEGLGYSYFSMKNEGFFYRSDQFSFARRGIPGLWLSAGEDFVSGRNHLREFFTGAYHTPKDEFDPNWSLESTRQTIRTAVDLAEYLNRHTPELRWKGPRTFPVEK